MRLVLAAYSHASRETELSTRLEAASPEARTVAATKWPYCFSIVQSADSEG